MIRIFLVLFCAGCVVLLFRLFEVRSIFFPSQEIIDVPSRAGLHFEDVFFDTADRKKLNGWFVPAGEKSETILFCHGNAGNISYRIDKLIFFNRMGYSVFIFDYRGYGKSGGWPSEEGLYRDAEAAYDYLRSRGIPAERIVGYGESIGGAVIAQLAFERPMKALIFENTFSSIGDMVRTHFPVIPPWLLASRFDTQKKMASIKIPKLIMQSKNDEIVPFRMGRELYEAAADPKDFLEIRGDHNNGFFESEDLIESKLRAFLGS
jgi:fermentation-respiration switch protein FrsA (DUF1100 family)